MGAAIFRSLLVQQLTKLWNGQGTGNKEKTAEKFIIKVKVKDQNAEVEQAYEEAQASDASKYPSSEEEEGIKLEREFEATKPKFKRSSRRERPPAHNPDYYSSEMCPSAPLEGPRGGVAFPVIETHNAQGQLQREHVPLDFKDIKQLKEAVLAYGTHAPFTLAIFESFTALHCAPCDWQQLCRAALSGGDYLLWRSEFQELCQQIANQNAAAGFPGRNLDMLIGAGQYANLAAQIRTTLRYMPRSQEPLQQTATGGHQLQRGPWYVGKSSPLVYGKAQIPSWCGPEELFVFFPRMEKFLSGSLSAVFALWMLLGHFQMETLVGNPQLLPSSRTALPGAGARDPATKLGALFVRDFPQVYLPDCRTHTSNTGYFNCSKFLRKEAHLKSFPTETAEGSHYAAFTGLELTVYAKQASNSQRAICLYLLSAEIKGSQAGTIGRTRTEENSGEKKAESGVTSQTQRKQDVKAELRKSTKPCG
ncbi:hypothetical protein STEG23_008089 [Scotinomys teguina]